MQYLLPIPFLFVLFWSIQAFMREEVTIKSKFLFHTYKERKLIGKAARRFSGFYFLGSLMIIATLSLYPVFRISSGFVGISLCGLGFALYALAFITLSKEA